MQTNNQAFQKKMSTLEASLPSETNTQIQIAQEDLPDTIQGPAPSHGGVPGSC